MFFLGFVNSQTVSLWGRGGCRVDFDGESSEPDPSVSPSSLPIESEEMGNTIEIFIRGRKRRWERDPILDSGQMKVEATAE